MSSLLRARDSHCLTQGWLYLKESSSETSKRLLSWKIVSLTENREVSTSLRNLWQAGGCVYISHVNAFRRKDLKKKSISNYILQGLLINFSIFLLSSCLKLWCHGFENCNELTYEIHHYKGTYRCLTMPHIVYEYKNVVFKIWADDLRRAKTNHETGKKSPNHLMLPWCWRSLVAIWDIHPIIKSTHVLSVPFVDNIKVRC